MNRGICVTSPIRTVCRSDLSRRNRRKRSWPERDHPRRGSVFILRWSPGGGWITVDAWLRRCRRATRCSPRSRAGTAATTACSWPPCAPPASSAAARARRASRSRATWSFSPPPERRWPPATAPACAAAPLDPGGAAPAWLTTLLAGLERDPRRRWTDADLVAAGLRPEAVRALVPAPLRDDLSRLRPRPAAGRGGRRPATGCAGHGSRLRSRLRVAERVQRRGPQPGRHIARRGGRLLAAGSGAGGDPAGRDDAGRHRRQAVSGRIPRSSAPCRAVAHGGAGAWTRPWCRAGNRPSTRAAEQIAEYFAGSRRRFELPLLPGRHRPAAPGVGDAAADSLWRNLDLRPSCRGRSAARAPPAPWAAPSAPTRSPLSSRATAWSGAAAPSPATAAACGASSACWTWERK